MKSKSRSAWLCPPKFDPANPEVIEEWKRNALSVSIGHAAMEKFPPLKVSS